MTRRIEWLTHLAARYRNVREPSEQLGEQTARHALYPRENLTLVGVDEREVQRVTDQFTAWHMIDEAFKR